MKQYNYKPIILFLASCILLIPIFAVVSILFIMIMSIIGMLGTEYGTYMFIYFMWFGVIDFLFYGRSKKQNEYLKSLEKNKKYTLMEDFKLFMKQEGITVLITYAIYAILAMIAKAVMPTYHNLFFNMFAFIYRVPVFPSSMLTLPIWIEYLLCFVCFAVLYITIVMWHRSRIRKEWC